MQVIKWDNSFGNFFGWCMSEMGTWSEEFFYFLKNINFGHCSTKTHFFLLVFQKCQTKTNYAFLSYMYGNYIFPHVLAHCPYSGCSSYLNSSSDTSKILSTNSLTCLYAFSPAKGGASPEAIDVASGQSTGRPSCNFKEDKI